MLFKKNPLLLYRNPDLYIKEVPEKGRGVFCLKDIKADETIEVAPVLIFPEGETIDVTKTRLKDYAFRARAYPEKFLRSQSIEKPDETLCIPFGMTALCNHMVDPNAEYAFTIDDLYPYILLKSLRDIPAGQEISVTYGLTWFANRKLSR